LGTAYFHFLEVRGGYGNNSAVCAFQPALFTFRYNGGGIGISIEFRTAKWPTVDDGEEGKGGGEGKESQNCEDDENIPDGRIETFLSSVPSCHLMLGGGGNGGE
jgi:hypothetical protein